MTAIQPGGSPSCISGGAFEGLFDFACVEVFSSCLVVRSWFFCSDAAPPDVPRDDDCSTCSDIAAGFAVGLLPAAAVPERARDTRCRCCFGCCGDMDGVTTVAVLSETLRLPSSRGGDDVSTGVAALEEWEDVGAMALTA